MAAETIKQLQAMYRTALTLRQDADPLLAGQFEGLIGRLSALLVAMGAAVPDDPLSPGREGE